MSWLSRSEGRWEERAAQGEGQEKQSRNEAYGSFIMQKQYPRMKSLAKERLSPCETHHSALLQG